MNPDGAPGRVTILFNSTHHAMWAEDVARERGIPAEVVPAPPGAKARCGLALETLARSGEALGAALDEEGIEFLFHAPDTADPPALGEAAGVTAAVRREGGPGGGRPDGAAPQGGPDPGPLGIGRGEASLEDR